MEVMEMKKQLASKIAEQNDLFRETLLETSRHRVVLTQRVSTSPLKFYIINAVRNFKDFNISNDPYSEHDLGIVIVDREKYMFKIDYYDETYEMGLDPYEGPVNRVITIMHISEY